MSKAIECSKTEFFSYVSITTIQYSAVSLYCSTLRFQCQASIRKSAYLLCKLLSAKDNKFRRTRYFCPRIRFAAIFQRKHVDCSVQFSLRTPKSCLRAEELGGECCSASDSRLKLQSNYKVNVIATVACSTHAIGYIGSFPLFQNYTRKVHSTISQLCH